ncbi:MAG: lipopolysaccharide heptosyltransferase I [Acidiferrobacterales bacterium]|nr:lipopolysaccharide heptosyltransferase I [Acidiferrobacterales bacterium]
MRILVIKLTSMGDVLHLLPALTDMSDHFEYLQVDWAVEDGFSEIPRWHPSVDRVINVGTRRWRRLTWQNAKEFCAFVRDLRKQKYDVVVDAQGLMKSAGLGLFARLNKGGKRVGFCKNSIKESLASFCYSKKISVERDQHAIMRLRELFSQAFDYSLPANSDTGQSVKYGIRLVGKTDQDLNRRSIFFLHGTTWESKHLPDQVWRELCKVVIDDGYRIKICWGDDRERQRAEWIAQNNADIQVLPKLSLTELARLLDSAAGAISVDTGLGHLAAALGLPTVSVYGSTNAKLTGALGEDQVHMQTDYPCSPCLLKKCDKVSSQVETPPCYQTLSAADIWQNLYEKIA